MEIREAELGYEGELLKLFRALDQETEFMLMEPGERKTTIKKQANIINKLTKTNTQVLFVASEGEKIVGFVGGTGGTVNRQRHSIHITMGVLASFWSRGIGSQLLHAISTWSVSNRFHRIELLVIEDNERAISLYKRSGFEIEGVKHDSLLISGKYINEYFMAKLI